MRDPDNTWRWLADRLPRRLVYFCGIRLWAHATNGPFSRVPVCSVTVDDALRVWEKTTPGGVQ